MKEMRKTRMMSTMSKKRKVSKMKEMRNMKNMRKMRNIKEMRRTLLVFIVLIAAFLLLFGCSSKSDNESTTELPEATALTGPEQSAGVTPDTTAEQDQTAGNVTTSAVDADGGTVLMDVTTTMKAEQTITEGKKREPRQDVDKVLPAPKGFLPSGIDYVDLEREIDAYVEKNKDRLAAMSISVFTAQGVLLEKAYGYTDVDGAVPNDVETVFEWGSITKTLIWISAMQLVEQGKLDLNADIRTYLQESFFTMLRYDEPITMLHLMNHTSGWPRNANWGTAYIENTENPKFVELVEELRNREPPQENRPGEVQQYSNYAPPVAAYVIECITGVPFYNYVHDNIFVPSGMRQTAFKTDLSDNEWVKQQRMKLNCWKYDPLFKLQTLGVENGIDPLYPAGMGTGTLSDLRRYGQVLLSDANGESPLFEKGETLALLYTLTRDISRPIEEGDAIYGDSNFAVSHGFRSETRFLTENTIGHAGGTLGCSSNLIVDKDIGIGMAVMSNQPEDTCFCVNIPGMVFGPYPTEFEDEALGFEITGSTEMVETGIRITWEPEDENTEYWVLRSRNLRALSQLNVKPATGGEYLDETAEPDTSYLYTIVKVGSDAKHGIKAFYKK